jgi:hypothetical protein
MADFNQLFESYSEIHASVTKLTARIKTDLKASMRGVPTHGEFTGVPLDENHNAIHVASQRQDLLTFLEGTGLHKSTLDLVAAAYVNLSGRNPASVNETITALEAPDPLPAITDHVLDFALQREDVEFSVEVEIINPKEIVIGHEIIKQKLPGYKGHVPGPDERLPLFSLSSLCSGNGTEFQFRIGLLRAERDLRLKQPLAALKEYTALMMLSPNDDIQRVRFLRSRKAHAHALHGDQQYRTVKTFNAAGLALAMEEYERAEHLLSLEGFSLPEFSEGEFPVVADDPEIRLVAQLRLQQSRALAHLNPLGLHDAFVPLIKEEVLLEQFRIQLDGARNAATTFFNFQDKGEALNNLQNEIIQQKNEADESIKIGKDKIDISQKQEDLSQNTINHVSAQQDFLQTETAAQGFQVVLNSAAAAASSGSGPAAGLTAMSGVIGVAVDHAKRSMELKFQEKAARIEKGIATLQKNIAKIEQRIAESRAAFLGKQISVTEAERKFFYALADEFEKIAHLRFAQAHLIAYLYERFICYRLGKHFRFIRFDYLDNPDEALKGTGAEILPAVEALGLDFDRISADAFIKQQLSANQITVQAENFEIVLPDRYPLEFQLFQDSGTMNFSISLYDLDKRFPGASHVRILGCRVDVSQTSGSLPTDFSGELVHHGFFLLRDRETTPTAKRLIPTDDQIEKALSSLENGNTADTVVEGVRVFNPGESILVFNRSNDPAIPSDLQDKFFTPITLMGPAGSWTLQVFNVNPKILTTVSLKFDVEFFSPTTEIREKILELLPKYEEEIRKLNAFTAKESLDKILALQMQKRFGDAFKQLKETGKASILIRDKDVPFAFKELKVKAVLLQAVRVSDDIVEGVGNVELSVAHKDAEKPFKMTTREDGFTANIKKEIELLEPGKRFSVFGAWEIEVTGGSSFDQVNDLRWFFILEFIEN